MKLSDIAHQLHELFHGLDRAYGTYDLTRNKKDGDKLVGIAKTLKKDVSDKLWEQHLTGEKGIGIVPINDDSKCSFGAIDIDQYTDLDYKEIIDKITKYSLPLVPCRSKSGGLHLFAFTKKPVTASTMRKKLVEFSAALGHGTSEVFPKQTEILADRGDVGQWINMPYFDYEKTERYGFNEKAKPMSIEDFLAQASALKLSPTEFRNLKVDVTEELGDGPPCLQHLVTYGFSKGTRNDGLFCLGVYLRKSGPDDWEKKLEEYNHRYMQPPLTSLEVQATVKSLRKKEYDYPCTKPPIKDHCNQGLCRGRRFGIGQLSGMPTLTGLVKYDSMPPIWFLDVEDGGRIELSTADLQQQQRFQRRCMEDLNIMPPPCKSGQWQSIIQTLLESVTIIEAPVDASAEGLLMEHLENFCTGRAQAKERAEILIGKPWLEKNRHYFRIRDFLEYLERHNFREFKIHKITAILKDKGGKHIFWNVKGKGINVWNMPEFAQQTEDFNPPPLSDKDVF
jgi:hypothetical protein